MKKLIAYLMLMASLWLSISFIRYRAIHPELTESQLMLKTLDVLAWKR